MLLPLVVLLLLVLAEPDWDELDDPDGLPELEKEELRVALPEGLLLLL